MDTQPWNRTRLVESASGHGIQQLVKTSVSLMMISSGIPCYRMFAKFFRNSSPTIENIKLVEENGI